MGVFIPNQVRAGGCQHLFHLAFVTERRHSLLVGARRLHFPRDKKVFSMGTNSLQKSNKAISSLHLKDHLNVLSALEHELDERGTVFEPPGR